MDRRSPSAANKNKKKRGSSDEGQEVQDESKRRCPVPTRSGPIVAQMWKEHGHQFLQQVFKEMEKNWPHSHSPSPCSGLATLIEFAIGEVVNRFLNEMWPNFESEFRKQVSINIEKKMLLNIHSFSPSPSNQHGNGSTSGTAKYKLRFCNTIASTIYHNDEIESTDKKTLKFQICDVYSNTIISNGPLSFALVEFFLLEQVSGSKSRALTSRDKTMELISFNNLQHRLKDGNGYVNNLIVAPNSYWISKTFFLGIKVIDESILMEFGVIEDAVSGPLKVKTPRMKGLQKCDIPTWDSEVWRLEGVGKGGIYHQRLSSELGVETVGDLLEKYHEMGSTRLKEIIGGRMSKHTFEKIVDKAKKCVGYVPIGYDQTFETNNHLVGAEVPANSNQNWEILPQNQSFEANDNMMKSEVEANSSLNVHQQVQNFEASDHEVSNKNLEVHQQNQSFETNHLVENDVEANSKETFQVCEKKKDGGNDELSRTNSFEDDASFVEWLDKNIDWNAPWPLPFESVHGASNPFDMIDANTSIHEECT